MESGRLRFETSFWNDYGQLVKKQDWLVKMFDIYVKGVKKNYRKSKYGSYWIGEDAFNMYKDGEWLMMSGPKYSVNF